VYLTEEQRGQFLELVRQDPGQAMLILSRISTRQSTCWVLNDQLRIHSLIESSVGFEAVDKQVHQAIARALHPKDDSGSGYQSTTASTTEDRPNKHLYVCVTEENEELLVKWFQGKGLVEESGVPEMVKSYEWWCKG